MAQTQFERKKPVHGDTIHVIAVIVTYFPDSGQIKKTLLSLLPQVAGIALIDNTPGGLPPEAARVIMRLRNDSSCFFLLIENRENLGIAAAQNIGITFARQYDFNYVLLSDQDSIFSNNVVYRLLEEFGRLVRNGQRVGAIGAGHIAPGVKGPPEFVLFDGLCERRARVSSGVVPVVHVIASGCLIPVAVFDRVGLKDESLFIDWVDIEWCLRARKAGFDIYGSGDAIITHWLGDGLVRVLGRQFTLHHHVRHYYMIRNAIRLVLYSNVMTNWQKVSALKKALILIVGASVKSNLRLSHIKMALLGISHGVVNKKGRIDT